MEKHEAKDRLIAAALGVAKAERGGLDHANADAEKKLADDIFDDAARIYVDKLNDEG